MTFEEQLRRAFDPLAERLREEIARQIESAVRELSARTLEQVDAAVASARTEGRSSSWVANERLAGAIRSLDAARSLSETLDLLVAAAAREAPRAGVLLARGTTLRGWRFSGFGEALDNGPSIEVPLAEAGVLAEALQSSAPLSGSAPSFAELAAGRWCVAVPIAIAGAVVSVLYADQGSSPDTQVPRPTLEVLTLHAARCLEALTAIKAAQALSEPPVADNADNPGHTAAGEAHAAARRYAKLLVSEIKLYHEAGILAGRRDRDLATRLGGEIARARMMYEERVAPDIRRHTDYFQEEAVRTLADGDPTLLQLT